MSANLRDQLQATLSGSYTIERELGGGGMSRVFLAEETQLSRRVVVKVLSTELAAEISAERFQREIRTAASLQQANIVPVLTAGNAAGVPYFTMPYVEGESLRARLGRTGALSIAESVKVMGDIARALAYAHARGIVHRDIKPDNVLLSGGTAVVTDFGIAKAISASRTDGGKQGATLTQLGTALGTPAYMAPEQAAGDPSTDHRADFYAFGCTAYELLTGRPPFIDRTPQRLLAAHMSLAPEAITSLRADVPQQLADLVMRCLEKEAPRRPATAGEIIASLDSVSTTSGGTQPAMPHLLLGGPAMFRKALAIYAGAFVAVAVLAKAAIVGIGLPDWVFAGSLIVMALGLPVILWTGYVQRVARRAMTMTPTYTPGGTPTTAHGTIATMALKAAPRMSWYRTARGGMYALGVFILMIGAFMGMRAFGIGPFGSLIGSGRLNARDAIIFTDFRTTNTDSTLGRVVSDAVRAGLSGTSAFTLTPTATVVAALGRMQLAPTTRVDSAIARSIAVREGIKAFVDGDVTGVAGGYIVSIRLVRADSGIELASFRETGDGPRGLIDAADRLARALRSKAGESLRDVNGTPALALATTSSLEALQKYSEGARANSIGDRRSIELAREAVAIDSTFASAWSMLGATLSNYGGRRSAIDSALAQAFRYRDRLPARERDQVTARYYTLGPGRDRTKAAAAYEAMLKEGDSTAIAINLGEVIRGYRQFARAESLNVIAARKMPGNGTALGNMIDMQLNQGKLKDVAATLARIQKEVPDYRFIGLRTGLMLYASGEFDALRTLSDTLRRSAEPTFRNHGQRVGGAAALVTGRLREFFTTIGEREQAAGARRPLPLDAAAIDIAVQGPSAVRLARLDSAIAGIPFADLALVDRPYFNVITMLARSGQPAKARSVLARYEAEVTDTSLRRVQAAGLHNALGEIALSEQKTEQAVGEFRRGDIGYDGKPANECAPCLAFNLARAFDAAGQADSATANYERYLATPFWLKGVITNDPINQPRVHERLGQLYEAKGDPQKAADHYRAFIELWKNADPELQPRVAAARERLKKLTPVEKPR